MRLLPLVLLACNNGTLAARSAPPTATIVSHVEGQRVAPGLVTLTGVAADPFTRASDLRVVWRLDEQAWCTDPPDEGTTTCELQLLEGWHTVQLEVTDPDGEQATATVNLEAAPLVEGNQPPTCAILEPADGAALRVDMPVRLVGQVGDDQPLGMLSARWSSDQVGLLVEGPPSGTGETVTSASQLPTGPHVLTLDVVDADGAPCRDVVLVTLGYAPDLRWTAPTAGATVPAAGPILLTWVATDPDEAPPGLDLVLSSDRDGQLWTGQPAIDGTVQVTLPGLSAGSHTLTVQAIDSDGLQREVTLSLLAE